MGTFFGIILSYLHILRLILINFEKCQLITISGPFKFFSLNKKTLLKTPSVLDEGVMITPFLI